uniref:Uncharacterized protein n=1 Tax=Avena sativa TaxID=4498 RepID=A0ACD6AEE2_AVESA
MEPPAAGAAGASAAGASRPPSFASQTNALLRKNLIFQKRNRKASIRLIMVPIFLCVLLSVLQRVINNLLDKPEYKCGCKCVSVNGSVPCQNVCGIQYSTLDQAGSCPIPNPPEWPTLLQVPRPEYRTIQDSSKKITGLPDASCRKSHSCPASIPFTGANESLSTSVMQNMFIDSPLTNLSDFTSTSSLLLGTDVPGTSTGFIESAFISSAPIYVLQSQCDPMDPVTVRITIDAINFQKEIKCVQGLPLWRNSSTIINEETFKGYRKGKTGEGIMEVAMAIAYLYIFGSGLMSGSLIRNFIEGGKFPTHWITVLEIIPAFSLYRGLYELSQYAIRASETGNPGMQWSDLSDHTNGMRNVLIIIIVEWKDPTWRKIAVNEVADRTDNDVHVEMEKLDIIKELRARYGGYYVLTMTTSSEFEHEVENLVLKLSPNARKVYHLSGTQKYELSKQEVRIADVFMAMENFKKRVEVQAWGLADTTMEDVFVKVATGAQSSDQLS